MNAIINTTSGQYRISVIYDKTTRVYMLIFSSMIDNKGQQYTCASYADAVRRFEQNCRFYGVRSIPRIPTEAEFLGIPDSVFPRGSKEVVYAKNRA